MKLKNYIKLYRFRKLWRKRNPQNDTYAENIFSLQNVSVGKRTYGGLKVLCDIENVQLKIGNYCSIAQDVVFLLGIDHQMNLISTYPFKTKMLYSKYEAISKGDIIIDDDVWIGYRVIIMSGVYIGQGAVIGAGAIVTKNVPPYAVVGGAPAKVIKYRFSETVRKKLLCFDFTKLSNDKIKNNIEILYESIDEDNIDEILNTLQ